MWAGFGGRGVEEMEVVLDPVRVSLPGGLDSGREREVGVQWAGRAAQSRVWAWAAGRKPSEEERGLSGSGRPVRDGRCEGHTQVCCEGPHGGPEVGEQGTQ